MKSITNPEPIPMCKKPFTLLLAIGLFSGCASVSVKEGQVPTDVLGKLRGIEGNYAGPLKLQTLDGKIDQPFQDKVSVQMSLDGPLLQLRSSTDIAGPECGSKIGKLKSLSIFGKNEDETIQGYFEFDRNRCVKEIESDQLLFIANHAKSTLQLYLIKDYVKTRGGRAGKRPLNITGHLLKVKS